MLAHPGYTATNLQTTGPTGVMSAAMKFVGNPLVAQGAAAGALSQLRAATDPSVRSGDFYGPGGLAEMRGYPTKVRPVPAASDPATGRRLWDVSEELTGVHFGLPSS